MRYTQSSGSIIVVIVNLITSNAFFKFDEYLNAKFGGMRCCKIENHLISCFYFNKVVSKM